jgi:hypothetical protein
LPGKTEVKKLTTAEAVECKISPDGHWVAYAKAKLPGGSDYHDFNFWRLYVVSIHGTGDGREENLIDDNGYWPSWGHDGKLYYSQVDGNQTRIMRATLDDYGRLLNKDLFFATASRFAEQVPEINECYVSPLGDWFAARVRQIPVPGVAAFTLKEPAYHPLAAAGSKGCMPVVSPDGSWAIIAGSGYGIRWGESPLVENRKTNQILIEPRTTNGLVYHPGFSSDGQWVMAAHSEALDHNKGPYDIYIYELDGKTATHEELLLEGGFNGWPDLWVGEPSDPPPPVPAIDVFFPSSYTIVSGESVELTWETSFADATFLDGGAVEVDGTTTVSPAVTTTYELLAENSLNPGVEATMQCTVGVYATPQPVSIDTFAVEPEQISAGEIASLSWQVNNPTTLDINGSRVAPTGTMVVEPLKTTTYTLTAAGHPEPVSAEVTLIVGELEKIRPPLLEDRGGCMCNVQTPGSAMGVWTLVFVSGFLRRRV